VLGDAGEAGEAGERVLRESQPTQTQSDSEVGVVAGSRRGTRTLHATSRVVHVRESIACHTAALPSTTHWDLSAARTPTQAVRREGAV
jgi:hypothetical protein